MAISSSDSRVHSTRLYCVLCKAHAASYHETQRCDAAALLKALVSSRERVSLVQCDERELLLLLCELLSFLTWLFRPIYSTTTLVGVAYRKCRAVHHRDIITRMLAIFVSRMRKYVLHG